MASAAVAAAAGWTASAPFGATVVGIVVCVAGSDPGLPSLVPEPELVLVDAFVSLVGAAGATAAGTTLAGVAGSDFWPTVAASIAASFVLAAAGVAAAAGATIAVLVGSGVPAAGAAAGAPSADGATAGVGVGVGSGMTDGAIVAGGRRPPRGSC